VTIYVVKTCDGDVYFNANRTRNKSDARDMAADQVLTYDLSQYDDESRQEVRAAKEAQDWPRLWQAVLDCGAIHKAEVRG
jgi:hypothetical protein